MSIFRSLATNVFPLFREEVQVARYLAFPESVGGITIPDPESGINDRHLQFDVPGLVERSHAVVFLGTTPHTAEVSFTVRLNNWPHLVKHTVTEGRIQSWHAVTPPGALKPEKNELVLAVSAGGNMTFSDVFILYTSNQLTVKKPTGIVVADH
jgi:hypothetical protein